MIKTRIVKFVGHIHNMQLCIEMISFINNENESLLRWFYSLCEPRNFSLILCPVAGCIQTGWGSDLCLPAVVLWNSAPHVSTMLGSNLDLSDSVLDILQHSLISNNSQVHHKYTSTADWHILCQYMVNMSPYSNLLRVNWWVFVKCELKSSQLKEPKT